MIYLDKVAYFRESSPRPSRNLDNERFKQMYEQRRRNILELKQYRPLSWASRFLGGGLTAGILWKINPYLAMATAPLGAWLSGRVTDDMTGRTAKKRQNERIAEALDARDKWTELSEDWNPYAESYDYQNGPRKNQWFDPNPWTEDLSDKNY